MEFLSENINLDDNMVCYYDELPLWSAPFGIVLLNNIPIIKNSKIVDIGYGTGFPLIELAQRFGSSCKVFGIDPWDKASDRANNKMKQYKIKNVELIKGIGENMIFDSEYIDDIKKLMKKNNFLINKIIEDNYVMRFADGDSFFNHYFIKLAFLQDWKEVIKEDNLNSVFFNIKDRLNNIANKKGEFVVNVPLAYIECEKQI